MSRYFSRLFLKTAVATVCLAGVLVVAGAPAAQARVKGPRLDSLSAGCGAVQDEADKLVAEYGGASNARKQEILTRIREIADYWDRFCRPYFGSINPLRFPSQVEHAREALDPEHVGPMNEAKPKPRDPKALVPRPPAPVLETETSEDAAEEQEPETDGPATPGTSTLDPTNAPSKPVSR